MIEVNEDFIKLNNKKYHPQKTTTRLLRAYKGDNFTDKTISKAISNINSTKSLILRDCNLSSIPLEIFKLKNLEYLDLSINTIKSIPDGISELKNLKNLSISYNLLDQINPEISNLPKLETLWFLDNRLELIPDELCEMKNLVELNITGNPINKLPMCVPRMSRLENFYFGTFSDSLHSQSILDQIELYKQINSNLNIRI